MGEKIVFVQIGIAPQPFMGHALRPYSARTHPLGHVRPRPLKIVFFGTSDFALPSLHALVDAGVAPDLVVTKPDSPRGRGRKIYPQEVRLKAEELGLKCEQPADVHDPEFMASLRAQTKSTVSRKPIAVSASRI